MRPIRKSSSPIAGDYSDYEDAKPDLISRLGMYCSYCERRIATNLAVEHIQPKKGVHGHPALQGTWSNFLLACVNCNSTKGHKRVILSEILLPDRDNTFAAYEYSKDGKVTVSNTVDPNIAMMAAATLSLVGLDQYPKAILDVNGDAVAIDRVRQRMNVWATATECFVDFQTIDVASMPAFINILVKAALASGHFSIWMKVFDGVVEVKLELIRAFSGTEESGCFDMVSGSAVTPSPNLDQLHYGSKI